MTPVIFLIWGTIFERGVYTLTKDVRISVQAINLLLRWSVLMGGLIILSNVLASRIWGWTVFGVPISFDAGLLAYPATYVLGDLLSEIYGRKTADRVALWCAVICAFAYVCFVLADFLPDYTGSENVEFSQALGFSLPIMVGSIVGFVVSQMTNNWIFEKLWQSPKKHDIRVRSIVSSLPSRIFDTILFNTIAFGLRMSPFMLLEHSVMAFIAGTSVELLLSGYIKWRAPRACAETGLLHGERYVPGQDSIQLPEIVR